MPRFLMAISIRLVISENCVPGDKSRGTTILQIAALSVVNRMARRGCIYRIISLYVGSAPEPRHYRNAALKVILIAPLTYRV